jgi:hypothetical protein
MGSGSSLLAYGNLDVFKNEKKYNFSIKSPGSLTLKFVAYFSYLKFS